MRISIVGWSCRGLRCPDVDIDLRQGDGTPYHVSFVQMPNGTGKTTTLDLLKASLSGDIEGWDVGDVRKLRRRGADNPGGTFKVKLLVDGRPLTFESDFDFDNGRVVCLTTRPGSGGVRQGWDPPPEVRRFLERSFLDLFIFNGELANKLFEPSETKAEEAIDALCQLYLLGEIDAFNDKAWEKAASARSGPKTEGALNALKARRVELMARRMKLVRMRDGAVAEMTQARSESEALERKIRTRTADMVKDQGDLADARTEEARLDAGVSQSTMTILSAMRMPLALSPVIGTALAAWKDSLADLKLPEATSAQFFTDLQRQEECICGNPMTQVMREQIDARAKLVLSSSENGQLNIIKADIEKYVPVKDSPGYDEDLAAKLAHLSTVRRSQLEAAQTVRALRRRIIEAGGDQVKEWEEQQRILDARQAELEAQVNDIDASGLNDRSGAETFSLARVDREIEEATAKITEASNTVDLRAKTDVVAAIIGRAENLARRAIKKELLASCNARLAQILTNDPIELDAIDGHLKLAGQERGSEAQMLSVGYTFLMTLLERGDNRFPLLVDSPVGKMDGTVRRHVGRLIPALCGQFITFVINTERADFVLAVESRSSSALYLTFFRKTEGTRRGMNDLPSGSFVETATGVLIDSKAYFDKFDILEEV